MKAVGKSIEGPWGDVIFIPRRRLITSIAGARKSSATAVNPLVLSARLLDRNALGFKPRTERL